MATINLLLKEIEDQYSQENFRRIRDFVKKEEILKGDFQFYEFTIDAAVTNKDFRHHLGFMPKDTIVTAATNGATVTFNYDKFSKDYIQLSTSGACVLRLFLGAYQEG